MYACSFPKLSMFYQCNYFTHIYEKAWETVPVTRPTNRGLRIAHPVRTSNAEAHADMYTPILPMKTQEVPMVLYTHHESIYRCFVYDRI